MSEFLTRDGRFLFVDAWDGDGNVVLYQKRADGSLHALWDKFSAEAEAGLTPDPIAAVPAGDEWAAPPLTRPPVAIAADAPIKLTDERDGPLEPRMYAYWSNAVILAGVAHVFVGHVDGHPRFFRVDLATRRVDRVGVRLPYVGTSEGWYWSLDGAITLCQGPRLIRVNLASGNLETLIDISDVSPGCRLTQAHSSDDGLTHSATVQRIVEEGAYPNIASLVSSRGRLELYPAQGTLDECQVTACGEFLLIKEKEFGGEQLENNRIITIATGEERFIPDRGRAVGHSDCGRGFVVGEADKPDPGACVYWDLRQPLTLDRCRLLFPTINMGHVSVRGDRILWSNATTIALVGLDGAITPVVEHGMTIGPGLAYDYQVEANLSPCGRLACWLSNVDGRLDAYIKVL